MGKIKKVYIKAFATLAGNPGWLLLPTFSSWQLHVTPTPGNLMFSSGLGGRLRVHVNKHTLKTHIKLFKINESFKCLHLCALMTRAKYTGWLLQVPNQSCMDQISLSRSIQHIQDEDLSVKYLRCTFKKIKAITEIWSYGIDQILYNWKAM